MAEIGHCKHGEFDLKTGCVQCIAESRGDSLRQPSPLRDVPSIATSGTGDAPPSVGSTTVSPLPEIALKGIGIEQVVIPTALVKIKPETNIQIQAFYAEALKAKEYAEARIITIAEDLKPAADDLILIRKLKKAMEEKRKEYVSPLQEHVKAINDAFKTLMEPIETADTVTGNKMLAFQLKQKLIREEQERINALRLEAAKKEMELKGELTESVNLIEVIPEVSKRVSTDLGSSGLVDHWKAEVIDMFALPNEYKIPDMAMLNAIAKKYHADKKIPGVRFYNEPYLATRTK